MRDGAERATYRPEVSWAPLDADAERELAAAFVSWLRELRRNTEAEGRSILAYHYSSYELTHLERILGADEVADLHEIFVDLYDVVRTH